MTNLTLNILWVVLSAFLVFFMQAGFMALESGLSRAKNSINVAIKNLADFVIAAVGFWVIGFGLMFGESHWGLFGSSEFLLNINSDPWRAAFFLFQAVFAGTAATIDSGALAERTKFSAYLIMSLVTSVLIYPIAGHWAWGSFLNGSTQGWLEALGFLDFAGSTVVHSVGAWVALAGLIIVGPRIGRFDAQGRPRKIHPHNLPMAYLGTFILFFGWFGFNAGSTLELNNDIAGIALNTMLSASFGAIAAGALSWFTDPHRRPDPSMIANGVIGGLVGITAGCAFVESYAAALIGLIAGLITFLGTHFLERVLKLDDVVSAIPVHGFSGVWGTLAVALFMSSDTLAEMGRTRWEQLGVQALGVVAIFFWVFVTAFVVAWLINRFMGMRVPEAFERIGLNVSEHGATTSILELTSSMSRIMTTHTVDESLKVDVDEGSEAGDLAVVFNNMIDALQEERARTVQAMTEQQQAAQELQEANLRLEQVNRTMKTDLQMAKQVQEAILPNKFPGGEHIHFSGFYQPMDDLGGDYYDVFRINEHQVGLVMADVSGHGVSSALITSMVKVSFGSHARDLTSAGEIMAAVNRDILASIGSIDKFVTAFFGIMDTRRKVLTWANAGHGEMMILRKNREMVNLDSNGPLLGVIPDQEYPTEETPLGLGDRIILYTDGIPEARDRDRRFFGMDHFREIIRIASRYPAEKMVKSIIEQVHHFKDGAPMDDDLTLLIAEVVFSQGEDMVLNLGVDNERKLPEDSGPPENSDPVVLKRVFEQGLQAFVQGRFGEALPYLERIQMRFRARENNFKVMRLLGQCYYNLNLYDEAISAWNSALTLNPRDRGVKQSLEMARRQGEALE